MVRMEIIDKSLSGLPRREEANILQMVSKMINAKKDYSLNEAESAYLIFRWIAQNIYVRFYDEDLDDPIKAYNLGRGTPKSLSSLFNNICTFLKVESNSISGYLKWANIYTDELESKRNYTWNYVEIKGEYYLLDVSMAADIEIKYVDFRYLYFGTEPEIFIRSHFPKESKWQLLSEPYTFEKFESIALLKPFFYLLGFKTISPDTSKITGNGKIILTSDKPIPKLEYFSICRVGDNTIIYDESFDGSPEGKMEINYNINEDECVFYSLQFIPKNASSHAPIVNYGTNYTKNSSLYFKRMFLSSSTNIEYNK